ncbi:MAG: DNA repair protein RadC [bacterium]
MTRYRIKDLPEHERPRERLEAEGSKALSNSELLALLIKSGTREKTAIDIAHQLLAKHGSLRALSELSVGELSETPGIGKAKACEIIAALELSRRVATHRDGLKPRICSPGDVAALVREEMAQLKKEVFRIALLNTRNELIRFVQVSEGTLDGSILHPRETFREAIREAARAIILLHNHPSGDPAPSGDDLKITRELHEAGRVVGIEVLDHVIIAANGFRSLKEMGVI